MAPVTLDMLLLLLFVVLRWVPIGDELVISILSAINVALLALSVALAMTFYSLDDNAAFPNFFTPLICCAVTACSVLLDFHFKYARLEVRDSEVARRLNSLNEAYLTYVRTLHTNTSNYQEDISSDDFLNDERLRSLLHTTCYGRFKIDIMDLKETSKGLTDSLENSNTSFSHRIYQWLNFAGLFIRVCDLKIGILIQACVGIVRGPEPHQRRYMRVPVVHQKDLALTSVPDKISDDLHRLATRISKCSIGDAKFVRDWEKRPETNFLVGQAEKLVRNIGYTIERNPRAQLPDFSTQTVVAFWRLPGSSRKLAGSSTECRPAPHGIRAWERLFGEAKPRERTGESQIQEGGRYRGICLLEMTFQEDQNQETYVGSGWLLNNDTVVTAGHNLYDPKTTFYACEVTISIGVTNGNVDSPIVEKQQVSTAAIHWGYFAAGRAQNDLALLKLVRPLRTANSIPWKEAPLVGSGCFLRIVGYPGDLPDRRDANRGLVMYKSEGTISYDLKDDDFRLQYNLDTFGGNSGSPILLVDGKGGFHAIGTHTGVHPNNLHNVGCPLGYQGNNVNAFSKAMGIAETVAQGQTEGCRVETTSEVVPGMKKVTVPNTITP